MPNITVKPQWISEGSKVNRENLGVSLAKTPLSL